MIKNWFVIKLTLQSDKHNYICSNAGAGIVLALRLMQHTRRSGVAWTNAWSSHGLVLIRTWLVVHVSRCSRWNMVCDRLKLVPRENKFLGLGV